MIAVDYCFLSMKTGLPRGCGSQTNTGIIADSVVLMCAHHFKLCRYYVFKLTSYMNLSSTKCLLRYVNISFSQQRNIPYQHANLVFTVAPDAPPLTAGFLRNCFDFRLFCIIIFDPMTSFIMANEISRNMMTSLNGNIFRVTGPLCGVFNDRRTVKDSDAELWCFLWSAPEQTVEKTIETLVIWDTIALILTSL